MKLGVLLDHLDPEGGGAEAHTTALMTRALGAGEQVALASMTGEPPAGAEHIRIEARGGRPERDRAFAERGVARLREAGCNVVFAVRHALDCDVYLPHGGLVDDARAAKDEARGGASFWTRVGRTFSRKHAFFQEAERALLASPEGPVVVAVSGALASRIQRVYPACGHRLVTVVNGVDEVHFDNTAFTDERSEVRAFFRVDDDAYVGLLLAHNLVLKGLETALRALAEDAVRELDPRFVLLVAGGRVPLGLRRLASKLGVSDRVRFGEPLPDPRPLYAAADVLVHPTWFDPCSLVCLEALAMSLPVVTTPRNGVREVMGQRGGIVVEEPGDPEALAMAIRVLADPELRAFTADDARYLAMRNRQSTRVDRVLDICRQVAGEG